MIKRPELHLVEGYLTEDEGRIYRLRETRLRAAPAEETWPAAGAWRDLVQKLVRHPVKHE